MIKTPIYAHLPCIIPKLSWRDYKKGKEVMEELADGNNKEDDGSNFPVGCKICWHASNGVGVIMEKVNLG